jgi:hypothetical protein
MTLISAYELERHSERALSALFEPVSKDLAHPGRYVAAP